MSDTMIIPSEIEHLDFVFDLDTPKTCQLKVYRANEYSPCGKLAVYRLLLVKPCAHLSEVLICQTCWDRACTPGAMWICADQTGGKKCGQGYFVAEAVKSCEKI